MAEYLDLGFHAALSTVNTIAAGARVHAAGYCLGGTLLSIAAAAMARDLDDRLASVSLLAAQTDFSEPCELGLLIDESQIALLEAQMAEVGYLHAEQMTAAFQLLRSYDLFWSRIINEYLLGDRRPMNDLMARNADGTRLPAKMHSQYLRRLYLQNDLASGRYQVGQAYFAWGYQPPDILRRHNHRSRCAMALCLQTASSHSDGGHLRSDEWRSQCRNRQ